MPDSGSEATELEGNGTEETATSYLDFGGIKIPPERLLQLMQTVHARKTVELDGMSDVYQNKRHKKKKKKRSSATRLSGSKSLEDASETASDIRSTTCTSTTATEYRDMRRPKYDALFDPELDDNGPLVPSQPSLPTRIKKGPPTTQKKEKQVASLEKITADDLKRRQRWQKSLRELSRVDSTQLQAPRRLQDLKKGVKTSSAGGGPNWPPLQSDLRGGGGGGELQLGREANEVEMMEVDGDLDGVTNKQRIVFDDDDTDKAGSESDSDMKFTLHSQIDRVEQLLDFEVS